MSTSDLTPPRLAVGSHSHTRDYGCAMNVLSWENGDTRITDLPSCTATPLAKMIHEVNDTYCTHTTNTPARFGSSVTLLCAPCSVQVLDLAHLTVGTTGTKEETRRWGWLWGEQLLIGAHGVLRHVTREDGRRYVRDAAAVMRRYADGETSSFAPKRLDLYDRGSSTEASALRLASLAYHPYVTADDTGRCCNIHATFGSSYLGVESYMDPFWPSYHDPRSTMLKDAHAAVTVWRDVMQAESRTQQVTEDAPKILVAA